MQLATKPISATWSHLLLITSIFQNPRWNLISVIILVAHEYEEFIYKLACMRVYTHDNLMLWQIYAK